MDTSLRLVLFLVAFLILAGILWDMLRSHGISWRRKKPKWSLKSASHNQELTAAVETLEFTPQDVVVLMVMARQPGIFLGRKLAEAFDEADLYYGDLQIFHRHANADGSGKCLFSVASAIEPGYFDESKIDSWNTPGLTLFFTQESRNQSIATFELMLRTAKLLAQRLDGEVKDQDRRPLTLASIEKYRERVRRPHQAIALTTI